MDSTRFDAFTRSMVKGVSRRRVLKGIIGSLVGIAFTNQQRENADAICSLLFISRLPCGDDAICSSGEFCSRATDGSGSVCCPTGTHFCNSFCDCVPNSQACVTSICTAPGTRYCNGGCKDVSRDNKNCGVCGNSCGVGKTCSNGRCCPKGKISCNGRCVLPIQCS